MSYAVGKLRVSAFHLAGGHDRVHVMGVLGVQVMEHVLSNKFILNAEGPSTYYRDMYNSPWPVGFHCAQVCWG